MHLHGKIIVTVERREGERPRCRRWRCFAPGWRLWLWFGFLARRILVERLPGDLWPSVSWAPSSRVDMRLGPGAERAQVRVEPVEGRSGR